MKTSLPRFLFWPLLLAFGLCSLPGFGQRDFYERYSFNQSDTLRGMLRPERSCYDVGFYELDLRVDIDRKYLEGSVSMDFVVLEPTRRLQIDLYANMEITRIDWQNSPLRYSREHNAVFVEFTETLLPGSRHRLRIAYRGQPQAARNPPWDGGFVWSKDRNGKPWVGVACEGDGASLWWPNKDHLSDEPDSVSIRVAVPTGLQCVANGNLRGQTALPGGYTRFDWFVSYPINNYNVTLNIADYAHFSDVYVAADGDSLALDYYVLPYNEAKAREHFRQVQPTLACFERFFGKYPFWRDGFALVETSYLGMEHQSAIAYGNRYLRGYLGSMIPRDMDWDYVIVHETGHEYFGNSVSCNDLSEMWIHESFTTYMEALFVECEFSYPDAVRYMKGMLGHIGNRQPILGPPDVNWEKWHYSDHYYKGAWVLHTLRHAINDDERWFALLKSFYQQCALSNIRTDDVVQFVNDFTGRDFTAFFEQYLWYPAVPKLLYRLKPQGDDLEVFFKWEAQVPGFDMPVLIGRKGEYVQVFPNTETARSVVLKGLSPEDFQVATELFLIETLKID